MKMKKIFQKMMILLVFCGFNVVFGSNAYDPFSTNKSKTQQALESLPFANYKLFVMQIPGIQKDDNCVALYLRRLSQSINNNEFFLNPKGINNDSCHAFDEHVKSLTCNGIVNDFDFFFDANFLEQIYLVDKQKDNDEIKENKKKLQKFVENIFALFFLFPQGTKCHCDNPKGCKVRNDLNLYKAYGLMRMCLNSYMNYIVKAKELAPMRDYTNIFGVLSGEDSSLLQPRQLVQKNVNNFVKFINHIDVDLETKAKTPRITEDEKEILKKHFDNLWNEIDKNITQFAPRIKRYDKEQGRVVTTNDPDKKFKIEEGDLLIMKTEIKKHMFGKYQEEQILQPGIYQSSIDKVRGFFGRVFGSKPSK